MEHNQNWRWPEKTWFRERLNAINALENARSRKSIETADKTKKLNGDSADKKKTRVAAEARDLGDG